MMLNNPGKYDELCADARLAAMAKGAVLIIFDGEFGNGFSVQVPFSILKILPEVLEQAAKQMRVDMEGMNND